MNTCNGPRNRIAFILLAAVLFAPLLGCQRDGPGIPMLPNPTGLTASQGSYGDRVRLQWNAVPGAEMYEVHRAATYDGTYAWVGNAPGASYNDTQVSAGADFWYRVRACDASECGGFSRATLGYTSEHVDVQPGELSATQGTYDDRIRITWGSVAGATRYELYRADEVVGPFELIATRTGTQYDDIDQAGNRLTRCHDYWYRLSVCTAQGCSPLSSGVDGWRGTRIEGSVTGLEASDHVYPDRIRLTWNELPGAASYTIYRGSRDNKIGTSETTTYDDIHDPVDNPLEPREFYTYWVRAEPHPDGACEPSGRSSSARGRATHLPGAPVGLASSAQEGRVVVYWDRGNSIVAPTHFIVHRATSHGGPYEPVEEVPHTATTYTDTDVATGVTYWYKIAARNDWGTSELSEPVGAQVL